VKKGDNCNTDKNEEQYNYSMRNIFHQRAARDSLQKRALELGTWGERHSVDHTKNGFLMASVER
jgi:hypothetical protein